MMETGKTEAMQRAAGLVTWVAVTAIAFYAALDSGRYAAALPWAIAIAAINFIATMLTTVLDLPRRGLQVAALWLQLASALAFGAVLPLSFTPIYTIIWIAVAVHYFPMRVCWWLLAGLLAAWFVVMNTYWNAGEVILTVVLYGTFHVFALLSSGNALAADAARQEVEALNRELVATQELLAEASRQGERTRIARDLHDLLGHHLTALSINLQIAERITDGEARAQVGECRALARLLLSDVREAVDALHESGDVDLRGAIERLAATAPTLDVDLDIDDALRIDDVKVAGALLRCVQESVTNTLRHADARRCWIRAWRDDGAVHLAYRDDGRVRGRLAEGNGISGMRERIAAIGGSFDLGAAGDALELEIVIPGAAA